MEKESIKQDSWISYKGDVLTKPSSVIGYSRLNEEQSNLFQSFLVNFYRGFEYPERWVPIKVKFIDKENYLRVDFKRDGNKEWFHVTSSSRWY